MADPGYKDDLRTAYDRDVERRNAMTPSAWRRETIDDFAAQLDSSDALAVLELGCGTGQLAEHLTDRGLRITAIDLSPGNVAATAARGIDARVADFADLPFPDGSFGAAYAVNSLIHVPSEEHEAVYREIRRVLRADALLLVVVWGGDRHVGPLEDEWLDPPRYFSFYPDDELLDLAFPGFEVHAFGTRHDTEAVDNHAQVLTLRAV